MIIDSDHLRRKKRILIDKLHTWKYIYSSKIKKLNLVTDVYVNICLKNVGDSERLSKNVITNTFLKLSHCLC